MKQSWEKRKAEASSHLSDDESQGGPRALSCRNNEPRVLDIRGNRGVGNN